MALVGGYQAGCQASCGSARGETIGAKEAGSHVRDVQARAFVSNIDHGTKKHWLFQSAELKTAELKSRAHEVKPHIA